MTTETDSIKHEEHRERKVIYRTSANVPVYGFGLIGALVYYIGHATTFWIGALGVCKALVWPAMLVYEMLKYLNM